MNYKTNLYLKILKSKKKFCPKKSSPTVVHDWSSLKCGGQQIAVCSVSVTPMVLGNVLETTFARVDKGVLISCCARQGKGDARAHLTDFREFIYQI